MNRNILRNLASSHLVLLIVRLFAVVHGKLFAFFAAFLVLNKIIRTNGSIDVDSRSRFG